MKQLFLDKENKCGVISPISFLRTSMILFVQLLIDRL